MSAVEKSLNTQIQQIYRDNKGIFYKAFHSKDLDEDEKKSIGYTAIWKALTKHNDKKSNFKTFLWNVFKNDCISYLRKKTNQKRIPKLAAKDIITYSVYYTIDDYTFPLKERERKILHYRFVDGMTFREIGEKFSLTPERVRQIVKETLGELKCYMN